MDEILVIFRQKLTFLSPHFKFFVKPGKRKPRKSLCMLRSTPVTGALSGALCAQVCPSCSHAKTGLYPPPAGVAGPGGCCAGDLSFEATPVRS